MKTLILAGGLGTRLSEETEIRPKPMVEIGGRPILWHILKLYSHYGFNDFIILLGYKGYIIKEYFTNYFIHQSDITIDMKNNKTEIHNNTAEPWKITLLDTGNETMTGGRIKRAAKYIGNEPFMLTYGDGVSDVDIKQLIQFHQKSKGLVTMTSVQPEGRYGSLDIADSSGLVNSFVEKPKGDNAWINAGFFVCESDVLNYIKDDKTSFEKEPLEALSQQKKLYSYKHHGFWQCMDTQRDKLLLNDLWQKNQAKWKVW
jgi:glucose-1-phosphate cytidylyltransferase